jgi:CheY-like chemotaxis protein
MRKYLSGSLLAFVVLASTPPVAVQTVTDPGTELAFMPRTMSVTLLNEGGKYVVIVLAGGSSGVDAARELYARQALRGIFLSANLDEPTRTELLPHDPIDFIGKPVLPILLQRALRKAEGLTEP